MRCLSCKYDLSHLTEHRCPECGTPFDPSDPSTFESPYIRRLLVKKLAVHFFAFAALSYAVTFGCVWYLQATSNTRDEVPVAFVALVNWPVTFGFLFIAYTFVLPRILTKR